MYQEEPGMLMICRFGEYITNDVLVSIIWIQLFPKNRNSFAAHIHRIRPMTRCSSVRSNEKNKIQSIYLGKPLKSKLICRTINKRVSQRINCSEIIIPS